MACAGTAEAWTTAALRIASTAQDVAAGVAAQLQGTSAQLISRSGPPACCAVEFGGFCWHLTCAPQADTGLREFDFLCQAQPLQHWITLKAKHPGCFWPQQKLLLGIAMQ